MCGNGYITCVGMCRLALPLIENATVSLEMAFVSNTDLANNSARFAADSQRSFFSFFLFLSSLAVESAKHSVLKKKCCSHTRWWYACVLCFWQRLANGICKEIHGLSLLQLWLTDWLTNWWRHQWQQWLTDWLTDWLWTRLVNLGYSSQISSQTKTLLTKTHYN